MSFIKKLLAAIGHFFEGLFNAAEKAYDSLSPEQQAALQNGSGVVAVINSMLAAEAADVRAAIHEKFPGIDEMVLENGLFALAKAFGITNYNNIDECIAALQKYFAQLQGNTWDAINHGAASLLAVLFAPANTKFAAIASLLEYVYRRYIRPSIFPNAA